MGQLTLNIPKFPQYTTTLRSARCLMTTTCMHEDDTTPMVYHDVYWISVGPCPPLQLPPVTELALLLDMALVFQRQELFCHLLMLTLLLILLQLPFKFLHTQPADESWLILLSKFLQWLWLWPFPVWLHPSMPSLVPFAVTSLPAPKTS